MNEELLLFAHIHVVKLSAQVASFTALACAAYILCSVPEIFWQTVHHSVPIPSKQKTRKGLSKNLPWEYLTVKAYPLDIEATDITSLHAKRTLQTQSLDLQFKANHEKSMTVQLQRLTKQKRVHWVFSHTSRVS